MARASAWIVLLFIAAGCGGSGGEAEEARLRTALDEITRASVERDYETVWKHFDSGSKAAMEKQLHDMQRLDEDSPLGREMWPKMRRTFDLGPDDVKGLDAQGYFIAMMRGTDRAIPMEREHQLTTVRNRTLASVDMSGTSASVVYREQGGTEQKYDLVLEDGEWKLKADVGSGVTETKVTSTRPK